MVRSLHGQRFRILHHEKICGVGEGPGPAAKIERNIANEDPRNPTRIGNLLQLAVNFIVLKFILSYPRSTRQFANKKTLVKCAF